MDNCLMCGQPLLKKSQYKYCSNLCQSKEKYQKFVQQWRTGLTDGSRGVSTRCISRHVRHYLEEKSGSKCSLCGWNQKNPVTGKVPLEIDHINGNSEDNREENLRIICPNCHSLSPSYRNLNRGHGRVWRSNKYLKNTSR